MVVVVVVRVCARSTRPGLANARVGGWGGARTTVLDTPVRSAPGINAHASRNSLCEHAEREVRSAPRRS